MDDHKSIKELKKQWDDLKNKPEALEDFLSTRLGIGSRTSMELAEQAAEYISQLKTAKRTASKWLKSGDDHLGVLAILTYGKIIKHYPEERETILPVLRDCIKSKRWKLREAVTLTLSRTAADDPELAASILEDWTSEGYPIMYKVALDSLSDPALLKKHPMLRSKLKKLSIKAMNEVSMHPNETGEPMKLLKETLSKTIIAMANIEKTSMDLMREWAKDPPLRPIIKASLADRKLRKKYPEESADILEYMETGKHM